MDIAVIGCGVIGTRLGMTFSKHQDINLKFAVDRNKDILKSYCEKFDCEGFTSVDKLLENSSVDIVYVGVPPKYHFEIVDKAISAGKHVICEKPISINAEYGKKMAELAEQNDVVTAINFPFAYSKSFATMKSLVQSHTFGEIHDIVIKIRFTKWPRAWQDVVWLRDHDQGGPLREVGSHFIYGVQELFGPLDITNAKFHLTSPDKYEDMVFAEFTVDNIPGIIDLKTDIDIEEENTLYINSSQKRIRYRSWRILEEYINEEWVVIDDQSGDSSTELVSRFVTTIQGQQANLVSFTQATNVQKVIDSIFDPNNQQ